MKKQLNKRVLTLLISSALLFSSASYAMSSSLVLGASAGGATSSTVTAEGTVDAATQTPATPAASVSKTVTSETNVNEIPKEVYIVKEGQTLWEIAQDSGLSIQVLMNKNQLSSSVIVAGQELVFD